MVDLTPHESSDSEASDFIESDSYDGFDSEPNNQVEPIDFLRRASLRNHDSRTQRKILFLKIFMVEGCEGNPSKLLNWTEIS